MVYIIPTIAVVIIMFIIIMSITLLINKQERKLIRNREELVSILNEYIINLRIYRNILKETNRIENDIYDNKLDAYDAISRYQKVIPK